MVESAAHPLLREIEHCLEKDGATDANLLGVVDKVLDHFGCAVGTIHSLEPASRLLRLRAHRGVPDGILSRVQLVPIGKGMAGLAAERGTPVQVCNLQTDDSGVARPGARETGMKGSIAVPILAADALRGTIGIGKPTEHDFTEAEVALLVQVASTIGKFLDR